MWKTNKWVIRHAIAHLHGPSIRAGVHCTGAHCLNRESSSRRTAGGGKPQLSLGSRCALSQYSYNPTWVIFLLYLCGFFKWLNLRSPCSRVFSKSAWCHLLPLWLLHVWLLHSSCASRFPHVPSVLQSWDLCTCLHSHWNTFPCPHAGIFGLLGYFIYIRVHMCSCQLEQGQAHSRHF